MSKGKGKKKHRTSQLAGQRAHAERTAQSRSQELPQEEVKPALCEELNLGALASDFVLQMEALKQTLGIARQATESVKKHTQEEFEKFADTVGGDRRELSDGSVSISIPAGQKRAADRIFRNVDIFQRGTRALASNFLIALVAEFDVFLAHLMRWLWSKHPAAFGLAQKSVRVEELVGLDRVSDIERILLEREIDELLRGSRVEQYSWLEKIIKTALGTQGALWTDFIEAHERRHLCVHTGLRVSRQYLINCEKLGLTDLPKLGDSLPVTPSYVSKTASVFSEMAVLTSQVMWRKIENDPHDAADDCLSEIAYQLLEDGKPRLAAALLKFALDHVRRPSSERMRKVWLVNYAQAMKRTHGASVVERVLKDEDWSASSADFQLAVAVLRDDLASAAELMKQIGRSGNISQNDYRDWPLFSEFRKTECFLNTYRDVFGSNFSEIGVGRFEVRFEPSAPEKHIEPRTASTGSGSLS